MPRIAMGVGSHVRTVGGLLLLVSVFVAFRCGKTPPPEQPTTTVRIATGLPGMTFKPLGETLVAAYRHVLPQIQFVTVETEGSVSNIQHLQDGSAELGLALADVAYMAYNGHISELGGPAKSIRGISVLHPSTVHLLVRRGSGIADVPDLRGRRVGIGPPGSGTAVTSSILLQAFRVPQGQVQQQTLSFLNATDALIRGDLDALFIAAADPVAAVRRATEAGAILLDVSGGTVDTLRRQYPFLRPATIPTGTYPGQTRPIQTVRVDVLLLSRAELDDTLVHELTRGLFAVLPEMTISSDYLKLIDVRRALSTPVPLHPGAALYYREQELLR